MSFFHGFLGGNTPKTVHNRDSPVTAPPKKQGKSPVTAPPKNQGKWSSPRAHRGCNKLTENVVNLTQTGAIFEGGFPWFLCKLMRWRAKRAEIFLGCLQGGKAPQAKILAILGRFQRWKWSKRVLWRLFGAQIFCK